MKRPTSKQQAQQAAAQYEDAAKGFANKRKMMKSIGSSERATEAADQAARMAQAARDMRTIADSL